MHTCELKAFFPLKQDTVYEFALSHDVTLSVKAILIQSLGNISGDH